MKSRFQHVLNNKFRSTAFLCSLSVRGAQDLEKTLTDKFLLNWLPVRGSFVSSRRVLSTLAQQTASIDLSVNQSYFQCGFLTCPLSFLHSLTALVPAQTTKVVKSAVSNVGALRCASFVRVFTAGCVSSAFWTAQSELTSVFVADLRFLRVLVIHKRSLGLALETHVYFCDVPVGDCTTTHSIQHWLAGVCLRALPVNVPGKHFSALSRRLYKRGLRNKQYCYWRSHSFA